MIETYIINLDHELQNFYKVKKNLKKRKFKNIHRFQGIYGKNIKNLDIYDKYLTLISKIFSPYGLLGSALSHYILLNKIYNESNKNNNNNNNKYALILEDDVRCIYNYDKILEIEKDIPDNCDILVLHSFEPFLYFKEKIQHKFILKNSIELSAPCCSYLIKIQSIPKFIEKKIWNYFDIMFFNCDFLHNDINIYIYKDQIFSTDYNISHNIKKTFLYDLVKKLCKLFNLPDMSFFLLFKILRIPFINYELNSFDIIQLIIFILILIILIRKIFYKYI